MKIISCKACHLLNPASGFLFPYLRDWKLPGDKQKNILSFLDGGRKRVVSAKLFIPKKEEPMEELPLGVKIIGTALVLGAILLLATQDKIIKILGRSSNSKKS